MEMVNGGFYSLPFSFLIRGIVDDDDVAAGR